MLQIIEGSEEMKKYYDDDDVICEFCLSVPGPPKRIIDASAEECAEHPGTRCLGRLANHGSKSANIKLKDILLDKLKPKVRVVVLKAKRPIEPLEQLRFNYGDKRCRKLFPDD